jgi:hypothetical protein
MVILLKALSEASGERIRDVWLHPDGPAAAAAAVDSPPFSLAAKLIHVRADSRKVSFKKLAVTLRRLIPEARFVAPSNPFRQP